tara:strand:+ start:217 stop:645 length:429 start_codon:yes stop_codon:yes gene_type:complete
VKNHLNEVASVGSSTATDTEPDFGNWLAGGRVRELGSEMDGQSDAWYRNGGYTQTDFPKADPIWAGDFTDLTVFNLDPGIYRTSAQDRLQVPDSWGTKPKPEKAVEVPKPHTNKKIEFEEVPEMEPVTDFSLEVPQYRDFFD